MAHPLFFGVRGWVAYVPALVVKSGYYKQDKTDGGAMISLAVVDLSLVTSVWKWAPSYCNAAFGADRLF